MRKAKYTHPQGYPYTLYLICCRGKTLFVPAVSPEQALAKTTIRDKKARIQEANVNSMIDVLGYKKTSNILKEFAPIWMTREGKVYYKNV